MKKIFFLVVLSVGIFVTQNSQAAVPTAISDLKCTYAESSGAVWLTWTPPSDIATYQVRRAQSGLDESNFSIAIPVNQLWPGTASRGLAENLTQNTTWFFAIKSVNATSEVSAISNNAWCFVPSFAARVWVKPVSQITDPMPGTVLSAGANYTIRGVSTADKGTSIQKIEISLDGGMTWREAVGKISDAERLTFEYVWTNMTAGTYNIKVRATDWMNNVEIPGEGIQILVSVETISNPPSNEVAALEAQITALQNQIVQILQQIIQLLSQRLGH
jgi:hypothetical protein